MGWPGTLGSVGRVLASVGAVSESQPWYSCGTAVVQPWHMYRRGTLLLKSIWRGTDNLGLRTFLFLFLGEFLPLIHQRRSFYCVACDFVSWQDTLCRTRSLPILELSSCEANGK